MRYLLISLLALTVQIQVSAQNCGSVTDFTNSTVDNGNGTTNYTFNITTTTASSTKSVSVTISCDGYTFTSNECLSAPSTGITHVLVYNNVPSCNASPTLDWVGSTNAACGGKSCASGAIALPVELVYFKADRHNGLINFIWQTASEENNAGFQLQSRTSETEWENIGWIAGSGNSDELVDYSFHYSYNGEKSYYRLKQMDFNGEFEYSDVIVVGSELKSQLNVYPNPAREILNFSAPIQTGRIMSVDGTTVIQLSDLATSVNIEGLIPGIYYVESVNEDGQKQVKRFMKL